MNEFLHTLGAGVLALIQGCATVHTPAPDGPPTDHFDGGHYFNPEPIGPHGWAEVWRWMRTRNPGPWPAPTDEACAAAPASLPATDTVRLTWVGHATMLIQTAGLNVLTDPIWSARASPAPFAGPRRVHPPALCLDTLPPIHAVLISHNHYDHLDIPTLRRLHAAHTPVVYAPPGHARLLARVGIDRVHELDWWQHAELASGVRLTAVPARHWSARGPFDRNHALWAGFHLQGPAVSVYFAGDTGYGTHFQDIRARLGAPDVALLPIGAYLPRWFMGDVHLSPRDAVRAPATSAPSSVRCCPCASVTKRSGSRPAASRARSSALTAWP